MEDTKSNLLELSERLGNRNETSHLGAVMEQHKRRVEEQDAIIENLTQSIRMLERKNTQIDGEVQRLTMLQGKNNALYSKMHGDRLRISKQLIDLESRNDNLEAEIEKIEEDILSIDSEMKSLNAPSSEEIYYEIVRGFGLDFIKNGGTTVARIKNKERSDVFYVNVDGRPIEEVCTELWEKMG
ncbi:hypothetical protein PAEPH01_0087 [Pancytospora epiphaga]|nr:hypothetical protein PAEPH01_0087 [Pancytospora epiphaga]